MARPIPVIVAVADVTTLPTASVLLDGSGSLPSGGATSITAYQWVLLSKPVGSAAALTGATTATPTLTNVDTIGDYNIFLKVTDDAGRKSFETAYGVQHLPPEDLVTFDVPLYAFEMPVAGAFLVVKAPYASGAARLNTSLYKPAPGEFGWLGHGLWTAIDLLAELRGEMLEVYDRPDKELLADKISSQTPAAGVAIEGLNIKDTGTTTTLDSNRTTIRVADNLTIAAGKTLKVEATGDLLVDTIGATSGGDITSSAAVYTPELKTLLVSSAAALSVNATNNLDLGSANGSATLEAKTAIVLYAEDDDITLTADTGDIALTATLGGIALTAAHGQQITTATTINTYNRRTHYIEGASVDTTSGGVLLPLHASGTLNWEKYAFANYGTNGYFIEYDFFVIINGTLGAPANLQMAPSLAVNYLGPAIDHLVGTPVTVLLPGGVLTNYLVRITGYLTQSNVGATKHWSSTTVAPSAIAPVHAQGESLAATGGRTLTGDDLQLRVWVSIPDDTISFKLGRGFARIV